MKLTKSQSILSRRLHKEFSGALRPVQGVDPAKLISNLQSRPVAQRAAWRRWAEAHPEQAQANRNAWAKSPAGRAC